MKFYAITYTGMHTSEKIEITKLSFYDCISRQFEHKPSPENLKTFLNMVCWDEKICIYPDGKLHSAYTPLYTNGAESIQRIENESGQIFFNLFN